MKYVCVLVTVTDMARARDFYETVLGQKVRADYGENILFEGGFALHLQAHFAKLIDGRPILRPSNQFELYFEFDDIDALVGELHKNQVEFVHEAREQPWRQKVVRFYDPDRNLIEVGESLEFLCRRLSREGKAVEEISRITNMPAAFVTAALEQRRGFD